MNNLRDSTEKYSAKSKADIATSDNFNIKLIRAITQANEGISITDEDDRFIFVNSAHTEIYGYSKEELLGKTWRVLTPIETFNQLKEIIEITLRDKTIGVFAGEMQGLRKDGMIIYTDIKATAQFATDGHYEGHICYVNDISEKKKSELEFAKLKMAVESANEVIFITDTQGIITYVNTAFTKLYGYTAEEVVNKVTPRILKSGKLTLDDYKWVWKKLTSKEVAAGEWVNKTKEGKFLTIGGSSSPVLDENGNIIGFLAIQTDVTEIKLAHEELQNSRQLFSDIINFLPDATLVIDSGHKVIAWNHAMEILTGIKAEDMIGKGDYEYAISIYGYRKPFAADFLISPELENKNNYHHYRRTKDKIVAEVTIDGAEDLKPKTLWIKASTIYDIHNHAIGAIESIRNITVRKYAVDKLAESEDRYRRLVEMSPDIIAIHVAGKVVYVNEAGIRFFDIKSKADYFGRQITDFVHPDDRKLVAARIIEIMKTGKPLPFMVEKLMSLNGQVKDFEIASIPTTYEGKQAFQIMARDITERKHMEDELKNHKNHLELMVKERTMELRQSRETFRALAENTIYVIRRFNDKLEHLYVNARVKEFSGMSAEDYIGKTYSGSGFPPNIAATLEAALKNVFQTQSIQHIEYQFPEGTWIEWIAMPEFGEQGSVTSVITSDRNITESKIILFEHQRALEREKELNHLKNRFISMVSHELRTPLSSILSSVEFLEIGDEKYSSDKKKKHVNRIQNNIDYMTSMIDEVLYVDKLDSNKIQPVFQKIYLPEFCQEIVEEIESLYPGIKAIVQNILMENYCNIDTAILKKILSNLISNAFKYNVENGSVDIILSSDANNIIFEIRDTGIGIPEDEQKNMFEPFYRMNNSQHIKGSGLGLSIVKKLVEQLNGTISFVSKIDKGAAFIVTIPQL